MIIHRRLIKEMARLHHFDEGELDPERDVLISAVSEDLMNSEGIDRVFNAIDQKLWDALVDDRVVCSVRNIAMDLAGNVVVHGTRSKSVPQLLVTSRQN